MRHIAYHTPCQDGLAGAFAAFLGLTLDCPASYTLKQKMESKAISFMPLAIYHSEQSRMDRARAAFRPNDEVFISDFSGGINFILTCCELVGNEGRVVILDHHKSAQEDFDHFFSGGVPKPDNLTIVFDMKKSGATVTRDYFGLNHENLSKVYGADDAKKFLRILELCEDHDLWRHSDPDSTAFALAIKDLNVEFDLTLSTEALAFMFRLDLDTLVQRGRALEAATNAAVAAECATRFPLMVETSAADGTSLVLLHCYCVVTKRMELRSEIGNALAEQSQADGLNPAACVAYEEPGIGADASVMVKTSFRSLKDFDVSLVARVFGGGGHMNAASAIVPRAMFEAWKLKAAQWQENGGHLAGAAAVSGVPGGGGDYLDGGVGAGEASYESSIGSADSAGFAAAAEAVAATGSESGV
jgi:uncharacterized protein